MPLNRLPPIKRSKRILVICEGDEEYDYFARLKQCNVWSHNFSVEIKNAKSLDNIYRLYTYYYQNDSYELILIYCDTEVYPYEQYEKLKTSVCQFHANLAAEEVIFFANPCTMQIILSHFQKVSLNTNSKNINSNLIYKLTGIVDYRATEKQRQSIMKKINETNYQTMLSNIKSLPLDYTKIPSSNMSVLLQNLGDGDEKWILKINDRLEEEK